MTAYKHIRIVQFNQVFHFGRIVFGITADMEHHDFNSVPLDDQKFRMQNSDIISIDVAIYSHQRLTGCKFQRYVCISKITGMPDFIGFQGVSDNDIIEISVCVRKQQDLQQSDDFNILRFNPAFISVCDPDFLPALQFIHYFDSGA